jgi:hypothetical protein
VTSVISRLIDFCSGRLKQRTLLRVFIPLILLSYFGSLTFAIWMFPGPFDWRTRSMSKLLYPSNNPQFHAIGSVGIAIAGLLTIPFAGFIGRRLPMVSPLPAEIGALAFVLGAISLILSALIVLKPFLHEIFARGAGICFGLGMLAFYLSVVTGLSVPPHERHAGRRIFLAWSLVVPPRAPGSYSSVAGCRSFSMVESAVSGNRKSIVLAAGILGVDRFDGDISVPARRRSVSSRCRLSLSRIATGAPVAPRSREK